MFGRFAPTIGKPRCTLCRYLDLAIEVGSMSVLHHADQDSNKEKVHRMDSQPNLVGQIAIRMQHEVLAFSALWYEMVQVTRDTCIISRVAAAVVAMQLY